MATTQEPSSSGIQPAPEKRRTPLSIVWRIAAIVVVILVTFALAHFLRHPAGFHDEGQDFLGPTAGNWPPEVEATGNPPKPDDTPTDEQEAGDDLRQAMAGLVMAAIGDDDDPDDPRGQDAEARRRFIAERFGLPYDYPRNKASADLMPEEAQVLVVFENPERGGCQMVLVRLRKPIDAALEAFCRHYEKIGWEWDELNSPREDPDAQPDQGWLIRFREGRRERIVYARARHGGEETLVAIYDPRY